MVPTLESFHSPWLSSIFSIIFFAPLSPLPGRAMFLLNMIVKEKQLHPPKCRCHFGSTFFSVQHWTSRRYHSACLVCLNLDVHHFHGTSLLGKAKVTISCLQIGCLTSLHSAGCLVSGCTKVWGIQ